MSEEKKLRQPGVMAQYWWERREVARCMTHLRTLDVWQREVEANSFRDGAVRVHVEADPRRVDGECVARAIREHEPAIIARAIELAAELEKRCRETALDDARATLAALEES